MTVTPEITEYPKVFDLDPYWIGRSLVPDVVIDRALRVINLDIVKNGLTVADQTEYRNQTNWFPALRFKRDIVSLRAYIPTDLRMGVLCEPQILLQFPDADFGPVTPHVDQPPPWSRGREYRCIIGIALSKNSPDNGGVRFWLSDDEADVVSPVLNAGDIVAFHPNLLHSGGYNQTGQIRHMVYFRYLKPTNGSTDVERRD